jgi:N-acetylmuramoyl-L-alanine amidase
MRCWVFILGLIGLPFMSFAQAPVYFSGLWIKPSSTVSQFTFILSQKTYGNIKFLPDPDRVQVELANTYKHFDIEQTQLSRSNVTAINTDETKEGVLRFTFNVNSSVKWEIHYLPGPEESGTRLQLTITSIHSKTGNLSSGTRLKEKVKTDVGKTLSTISGMLPEINKKQLRDDELVGKARYELHKLTDIPYKPPIFTVAIDAGHGGKDSGAVGEQGVKEKNIVLNIAKKLAAEINQQHNMRAVLTRSDDYFVPLRDRLKFARKDKADIYIAIHADAYFNRVANGVSVYALSQRGATSEAARWLAHRDNYSELGGVALNTLPDNDPVLRFVLVDLAQTASIEESIRLGNKVLDALDPISSLHYRQVERAPFVVLKSPDIPSILVETGFISNPEEEKRLNDPAYQQKIAHSLWQGINMYFHQFAAK